ncbi:cupin domain-containing protein [Rhizobium cauense]|nr:cupin domain-containing protein [Rhizobium cauense]
MNKVLSDYPGKEGLMILVEYGPGGADLIHKHDAHAFIYVLEGTIVMQLKGKKEVALSPGDTFYEGPSDIHLVGRNASTSEPAKFIVLLLKDKDAPQIGGELIGTCRLKWPQTPGAVTRYVRKRP